MVRHRYRQLLLFLVVLVLPSAAIVVQSRKISSQEQETAKEESRKRADAERKRTSADIGQDLLARLERIKLQEIANTPPGASPRTGGYSDAAVAAVGWLEGERLVWPWDIGSSGSGDSGSGPRRVAAPEFTRTIAEGERAEFAEKRYDRAADLYRQSVEAARDDGERASARLRLARTLGRSGAQPAAIAIYRDMLRLPLTVTDEYGVSSASYAALRLAEWGAAGQDVLDRVNRDLEAPAAMAPMQTYRLKNILETLAKSKEPRIHDGVGPALDRLSARVKDLEQARGLQQEFPKLRVTGDVWQPYESGGALWLIGQTPAGTATRPLVIAVRAEVLQASVEADRLLRKAGLPFQIGVTGDSGEPVSERIPGLRTTFSLTAPPSPSPSPFWGTAFASVVTLTLFGGFLLWRDTRREGRIAELRTEFVHSVSHELKTPLTSIRMLAEILQMRGNRDPQLHDEYLEIIVTESERLTRLLNNVLDFSRIERGQKTYRLEPSSVGDVVRQAVRTIQYPLTEQGFVLELDVSDGIPPVAVDRDALQQAILNLLTNAMKYSGDRRQIELRLSSEKEAALIEVTDHGIGIADKEQDRIFENFYRAPVPENREISGTGLGLSLVAHIAKAHGGSVGVKSKPGEGSTFSIRLPLQAGGPA